MYHIRSDKNGNRFLSMPDFFCTVGFGLDYFAVKELQVLPLTTLQQTLVGKVFFHKEGSLDSLLVLKTVERLFVKVVHVEVEPNIQDSLLEDWLTCKLSHTSNFFSDCLLTWKEIANINSDCAVKFRINSRLSGGFRKASNFQRVSSLVGSVFMQHLDSCVIDVKDPDLEIFLHLNDSFLTVGLQVTKKPLSHRSYLNHILVRSTVCVAMCMAVDLSSKDVILDPMCGAATILVEAIKQFNCKAAVGVDCDPLQLKLAQDNLSTSLAFRHVDLICGDSRSIIFKDQWFDVVLCDVPFGRKFGEFKEIQRLLTSIVKTVDIVLKPGGRVGILISEKLRQTLIDLCPDCWTLHNQHPLRLGTLPAAIVTWKKTLTCPI